MATKSDFLEKLTIEQLKEIAVVEEIEILNGATKSEIIRQMLRLSMNKIKKYVTEYTEDVEEIESPLTSPVYIEKPSALWYLVPFFFGILGGLIGYVGVKDEDPIMAFNLLKVGIVMTFVNTLVLWWLFSSRPSF